MDADLDSSRFVDPQGASDSVVHLRFFTFAGTDAAEAIQRLSSAFQKSYGRAGQVVEREPYAKPGYAEVVGLEAKGDPTTMRRVYDSLFAEAATGWWVDCDDQNADVRDAFWSRAKSDEIFLAESVAAVSLSLVPDEPYFRNPSEVFTPEDPE